MHPAPGVPQQTPAQWAVRWHGLAFGALLAASVPVVHLVWHGLLGHTEPVVVTRSQTRAPQMSWSGLADGSWMLAGERHLREASPIVGWLRGTWNEVLWRAGAPQSAEVHVGRGRWLFQRVEVTADVRTLEATAAPRRAAFASVRDRLRASGVDLVVAIVPDKSRVLPDLAHGGPLPPAKAPAYDRLLGELRELGIVAVDLQAPLVAARTAFGAEEVFYTGDTHWRPRGAFAAMQAVAAAVEAGPRAADLGPRLPLRLGAGTTYEALGDLVASLGLCTAEVPASGGRSRAVGLSLLAQSFAEERGYWSVAADDPAVAARLDGVDAGARIGLVGTSFSGENGLQALELALGRPVHFWQDDGASGLRPIRRALADLADPASPRPAVLVWEIVERGLFEAGWRDPGL